MLKEKYSQLDSMKRTLKKTDLKKNELYRENKKIIIENKLPFPSRMSEKVKTLKVDRRKNHALAEDEDEKGRSNTVSVLLPPGINPHVTLI